MTTRVIPAMALPTPHEAREYVEPPDPPHSDDNPDFITAVSRAFAVLSCFRPKERRLGIREIARRTGLPKSTIGRLCYTLTQLGYLEFLPVEEKYAIGVGVLSLAQHYLSGLDAREVARPLMRDLAEEAQASVAMSARDGDHMVLIEMCHGHDLFRVSIDVGMRVPRGTTALGRAGHVALSEEERARVLASFLRSVPTKEWPKVQKGLADGATDYAKYGFVLSLTEWNREVNAVAVPLMLPDEGKLFALSCFGPSQELTRERLIEQLGPRLVQLRDKVKARLGR